MAATVALTIGFGCGGGGGGAQSTSKVIGTGGGTVAISGSASIAFPAGAVNGDFTVRLATVPGATPPPGMAAVATPIALTPKAQTFAMPVQISIPMTATMLPAGAAITDIVLVRGDFGSNVVVPLTTTVSAGAVVAVTDRLGDFAAIVPQVPGTPLFGACGDTMCDTAGGETCDSCPVDCNLCAFSGDVVDAGVDPGSDGGAQICPAPTDLAGMTLTIVGPTTDVWAIDPTLNSAVLNGGASSSYTFGRLGGCDTEFNATVGTTLTFYVLTWTSSTGGNCTVMPEGGATNPCTFTFGP